MENLKIKFKLNGLEVELEGREETVIKQVDLFKEFVLQNLPSSSLPQNHSKRVDIMLPAHEQSQYLTIKELIIKDIPKSETEWILIYAFFISKDNEDGFSEVDIRDFYESSKRKNLSRMKNFATNFNKLISNNLAKPYGDRYLLTSKGEEFAINILTQKASGNVDDADASNSKVSKKTKKIKAATNSSFSIVNSLNLNPRENESLRDFYNKFETKSFFERNLLFVYYLQTILNVDERGINEIYTCYKNVGEKVPGNLYQSLVDTKNAKGWIDTKDINKLTLTIAGENYVEHDFKRN